jgi:hypothetical protein
LQVCLAVIKCVTKLIQLHTCSKINNVVESHYPGGYDNITLGQ